MVAVSREATPLDAPFWLVGMALTLEAERVMLPLVLGETLQTDRTTAVAAIPLSVRSPEASSPARWPEAAPLTLSALPEISTRSAASWAISAISASVK